MPIDRDLDLRQDNRWWKHLDVGELLERRGKTNGNSRDQFTGRYQSGDAMEMRHLNGNSGADSAVCERAFDIFTMRGCATGFHQHVIGISELAEGEAGTNGRMVRAHHASVLG